MDHLDKPKREPSDEQPLVCSIKFGAQGCDKALVYGKPCPYCGQNTLEYDGLLNLVCTNCGQTQTGAST